MKNIILLLMGLAWFVATVMICFTIIGFFFLLLIDEWWEFPKDIIDSLD